MARTLPAVCASFVFALSAPGQAPTPRADDAAYVKAHYTKFEYKVPMRDGVKLFTAVYVPKDESQKYPIHLTRTPYSVATYDTIEWLVKNIPNNNGKVGQSGISYPGFYTAAGMIDAHPALVASSPQAPVTDWFAGDDFHHNGALFLPHLFNFMSNFGRPRPE